MPVYERQYDTISELCFWLGMGSDILSEVTLSEMDASK